MEDPTSLTDSITQTRTIWFVIGAVFTLVTAALSIYFSNKNVNRKLFMENITAERGKWRERFREDVSAFCSLSAHHYYNVKDLDRKLVELKFAADIKKLNELRVKIRLRLNPHKPIDSPDTKLIRSMGRVILQFETQHYENLHREFVRIERCSQHILKSEWEKSKREAVSGQLERRN